MITFLKGFWARTHDKVRAAFLAAIGFGLLYLVDQFASIDLQGFGAWQVFASTALVAAVAYAKKEITAFFLRAQYQTQPGDTLPPPVIG